MYTNNPVPIPKTAGKITIRKQDGSEYIQFETGRRYDAVRKYNVPVRKIIGIRIPSLPTMMLPNENYYECYQEGDETMNEEQKKDSKEYSARKKRFLMLRDLFDQMYFEFQIQSRKNPEKPVNSYKAQKINSILSPLREIMQGEEYADYLDTIETEGPKRRKEESEQKTYSDVALMLTQYKGAIKRYNSEKL